MSQSKRHERAPCLFAITSRGLHRAAVGVPQFDAPSGVRKSDFSREWFAAIDDKVEVGIAHATVLKRQLRAFRPADGAEFGHCFGPGVRASSGRRDHPDSTLREICNCLRLWP